VVCEAARQRCYWAEMPGVAYNRRLLKMRRVMGLRRMEQREVGRGQV
jgi:hypothetical protein